MLVLGRENFFLDRSKRLEQIMLGRLGEMLLDGRSLGPVLLQNVLRALESRRQRLEVVTIAGA